jgi:predicted SAM-dependent methyltransferase
MNLDITKKEEILELIELVINDDTYLMESLNNTENNNFYSRAELQKTVDEISNEKMKKIFQKKLTDYTIDRKNYLMEKYGKFFLNDRLVRTAIGNSLGMKKKYSMFKKYY